MRFFTARRLALAAVLPVLFTFTIIPGCAEESEGERCGDMTGPNNSDCQAGLTCTQIDSSNAIFRCCNPNRVTNSRCVPVVTTDMGGAGGASAGTSGASAGTSGDNTGTGGASAGTGGGDSAGQAGTTTEAGAGGA